MNMTVAHFRLMLWIYIGWIVVASLTGFVEGYSAANHVASSSGPSLDIFKWGWATVVFLLGLLIAYVFAIIGLFNFKSWSRPLAFTVTVVGFACHLLVAPTLESGFDNLISEASATIWGAILSIAYFSEISSRFKS